MFSASQRQQDIFDTWKNTDENILINAVAGSGKTTTLLQLLELCEHKTLFLAFNKSIQEEIQAKIDSRGLGQGKAMTLHSLGLLAIRNSFRRWKINNGKNFDLIKKLQDNERTIFKKMTWEDKLKLSYNLMDMNDVSRLFLTDNINEIEVHFESMDKVMTINNQLIYLWEELVKLRNKSYEEPVVEIDFNDMIYLPIIKNLRIPIDPVYLMVDKHLFT
jgi:DNA helicase-2/ATP-dependent DNA helicase PcrA